MASIESHQHDAPRDRGGTQHIAALLEEADRHIKEGNTDAALELIRRAQAQDRDNVYALAYVERIQALMSARKARGILSKGASQMAPSTVRRKAPETTGAEGPAKPPDQPEGRTDARAAAMKHAVEVILSRAREYAAAKNFDRAAAELDRARLLDPEAPALEAIGAEILAARAEEEAHEVTVQRKRHLEEEERKRSLLEQELTRVRQQNEEKRLKEDQAKRSAQEQKVRQYLRLAREHLDAARLDLALDQLSFVTVIDPLNAEAAEIQRQIREVQERKRQEDLERRRRREEEERQRAEAVQAAVRKNLETASVLAGEKKFAEALRQITRAYMLDPLSDEVRACEQGILEAQEESARLAEEQRRAEEDAARLRQEEDLRRLTEAERARLLQEQEAQSAEEHRMNKEKVSKHLQRAREFLASGSYHDALAELAQAFALDPFDEDVRQAETEVLDAQRTGTENAESPAQEPTEPASPADEIGRYLQSAQAFRSRGEFARALDELTKAFVLDPLNATVRALEAEIEGEYRMTREPAAGNAASAGTRVVEDLQNTLTDLTHQLTKNSPEAAAADQTKLTYHINRARRLMEGGALEDALAEVALGLTVDPENSDLRALEAALWERRSEEGEGVGPGGADTELRIRIRAHLDAAEEYQHQGQFELALDEIAKAYQLDPLDDEIRKRENAIREQESQHAQPGDSPLKLVYPRKDAAGGAR